MPDFREQLRATAHRIVAPGKGILAADESPSSVIKKFSTIGIENNAENRRCYREMLICSPGLEEFISGVILQEETARQVTDGKTFVQHIADRGMIPGIKVDKGTAPLVGGHPDETWTKGLDSLDAMAKEFYAAGCRFAKWRAVISIGKNGPSELAIQENAWGLARYALICQENGLVPIVEPEVLADGEHSIEKCLEVTQKVMAAVVKALHDNHIFWEGTLLKPNMVTYGLGCPDKAKGTPVLNATLTLLALSRTMPPSMAGVVFLSGGQSEEEASLNLNAINQNKDIARPWPLTFSYGRALQNSALKAWAGKAQNVEAGRKALLIRAKCNSEAQRGIFGGSSDESAKQSLYQPGYKY